MDDPTGVGMEREAHGPMMCISFEGGAERGRLLATAAGSRSSTKAAVTTAALKRITIVHGAH